MPKRAREENTLQSKRVCHRCPTCQKVLSTAQSVDLHRWFKHDDDQNGKFQWRTCPNKGCPYRAKQPQHVETHCWAVHNDDQNGKFQWHICPNEGCPYRAKQPQDVDKHCWFKHDDDQNGKFQWHACPNEGCSFRAKQSKNVRSHCWFKHDDDQNGKFRWHACPNEGCPYRTKQPKDVDRHCWFNHDDDQNGKFQWYACSVEDCPYRAKQSQNVDQHCWDVHNDDQNGKFQWHACPNEGCSFRAKQSKNVRSHLACVHDIGKDTCDFCARKCHGRNAYTDQTGTHQVCRACYQRVTGKHTRIEKIWSDYTDKHLGTTFLLGSDKSLISQGGCQRYKPDKLYNSLHQCEVDECDEHQHLYNNGDYACDEKRISDIYEEDGIAGKTMVVIRWNPHGYTVPEGYVKKKQEERLAMFVALKRHLRAHPPAEMIHVYYMFYSGDNPRISRSLPHTLIYDVCDFPCNL